MDLSKKKILVTGADGFIGSHLVEALIKKDCDIRAFTYYNSFNSWGWLDSFDKKTLNNIEVIAGDIRDPHHIADAIKTCDVVFHLAALIAIPFSYHAPDAYVSTNIGGTLNVLQACKNSSVSRIIVTSTSEVYGTARYVPINEEHPLQGQSPYSASKIGADKIAEAFHKSFEMPIIIARPFNTYGPRQSARAVIPTIITQLLSGEKEIELGDLSPTRDFNYVADTVEGFIALAEADETIGKEINISTGMEYSIEEVVKILIEEINPLVKIVTKNERLRPEKSEVYRLLGDNSKIRNMTSWQPKHNIKEGLKETVLWFKKPENICKYKSWIYNL
ncbi:MAG: NAD-dependent 4,6-dehydratase LegB [Alphaproteobacteria bacterium]|nr:NAD-dependent 4,6-dehydratase LegB [Alphaproteobacteria bacterium]